MTKTAAINDFWSSFGLLAIDEASVPTGENAPAFPYITYEVVSDGFGKEVPMSGSIWYRSPSWKEINAKADEIRKKIGMGGIILLCDDGAIWIKRGSPFSQNMGDPADDLIKRVYINLTAEFLTND